MKNVRRLKLLLTGGGTAGSVIPLIACVQKFREKKFDIDYLFLGTQKGEPERDLVESNQIPFKSIYGGKLRRYFSWRNFGDLFLIVLGFFQSFFIILKFKPNIVLSAGSFISVPVIWASWILRIPSLVHQPDLVPGLAAKLMSPLASKITITFEKSLGDFPSQKTLWIGNPVRSEIFQGNSERAWEFFKLEKGIPTVLILGGGTGALRINEVVKEALPELRKFCQIIHLTGKGKNIGENQSFSQRYHVFEFLSKDLMDAYKIADVVISRGGVSTLSELAVLSKPAIIIPLPDSPQEENARYFEDQGAARVIFNQDLNSERLTQEIKKLIENKSEQEKLSENIKKIMKSQATKRLTEEILKLIR